jgi:hypothetical protein
MHKPFSGDKKTIYLSSVSLFERETVATVLWRYQNVGFEIMQYTDTT